MSKLRLGARQLRVFCGLIVVMFVMGCAAGGALYKPIEAWPNDHAVVNIYFPKHGANRIFSFKQNDVKVGRLGTGKYLQLVVPAGEVRLENHVVFKYGATGLLDIAAAGTPKLQFIAEPDSVYFVRCWPTQIDPFLGGGQELLMNMVPREQGEAEIVYCKGAKKASERTPSSKEVDYGN